MSVRAAIWIGIFASGAGSLLAEAPAEYSLFVGLAFWICLRIIASPNRRALFRTTLDAWTDFAGRRVWIGSVFLTLGLFYGTGAWKQVLSLFQGEGIPRKMESVAAVLIPWVIVTAVLCFLLSIFHDAKQRSLSSYNREALKAAGEEVVLLLWAILIWQGLPWLENRNLASTILAAVLFFFAAREGDSAPGPKRIPRILMPVAAAAVNAQAAFHAILASHDYVLSHILIDLPGPLYWEILATFVVTGAILLTLSLLTDFSWHFRLINWAVLRRIPGREPTEQTPRTYWNRLFRIRHWFHLWLANKHVQRVLQVLRHSWQFVLGRIPDYFSRVVSPDRIEMFLRAKNETAKQEVAESQRRWRANFSKTHDELNAALNMSDPLRRECHAADLLLDYFFCSIESNCPTHSAAVRSPIWELLHQIVQNIQATRLVRVLASERNPDDVLPFPTAFAAKARQLLGWYQRVTPSAGFVCGLLARTLVEGPLPLAALREMRESTIHWLCSGSSPERSFVLDRLMMEYSINMDNVGLIEFCRRLEEIRFNLSEQQHLAVGEAYIHYAWEISPSQTSSRSLYDWAMEEARGHCFQAGSKVHLKVIASELRKAINARSNSKPRARASGKSV